MDARLVGLVGRPARALIEHSRVVLYLLALLPLGLVGYSARRMRWSVYGLAAAIFAACAAALVARTLPELIHDPALYERSHRLGYPVSYWNGLGLLAAVGVVLCGHLTCSTRERAAVRVLAAGAVPVIATTLYYTFSRGATWAALGAVGLYVLVGRPRGLLTGGLATAPATMLCLLVANPANALTNHPAFDPVALDAGREVMLTVVAAALGAMIIRALLIPVDARLDRISMPAFYRRRLLAGAAAAGAVVVLAGCAALSVPSVVEDKYEQFSSTDNDELQSAGSGRLFDAGSNGRQAHWNVALAAFRDSPLHGSGAGTYALEWVREREDSVPVQDAHSLYVELLGELGIPGLVLAVAALVLILAAFAFRARGPDRALYGALLAAGLAWAVHAAIDWDWELTAVSAWLFLLGGAALARRRPDVEAQERWLPVARVGGVAACLAVAVLPGQLAMSQAHLPDGTRVASGGRLRRSRTGGQQRARRGRRQACGPSAHRRL